MKKVVTFRQQRHECSSVSQPQWQLFFCTELSTGGTTGLYGMLSTPSRYISMTSQLKLYSAGPAAAGLLFACSLRTYARRALL